MRCYGHDRYFVLFLCTLDYEKGMKKFGFFNISSVAFSTS